MGERNRGERLKIGLIGCGGISKGLYVNNLTNEADRVDVVAVCDIFPEKARERSEQFRATYEQKAAGLAQRAKSATGAERARLEAKAAGAAESAKRAPRVYEDHEKIVRDPELRAAWVTTQPMAHAIGAIAAAEAGLHVWSEGPMAANVRDADRMVETARRRGVKMTIQNGPRFCRSGRQAKLALASGRLGRIVLGRLDTSWYHTMRYYQGGSGWRGTYQGEGGGSIFHHGRYGSDFFMHLMGESLAQVFAVMGTYRHDIELEDASSAALRFTSGAIGHATTTICAHHNPAIPYDRVEFLCEKASVQVYRTPDWQTTPISQIDRLSISATGPEHTGTQADLDDMVELKRWLDEQVPPTDEDMQVTQLRLFLDCIENDTPEPVTPESAQPTIELMRASYKSVYTGQPVTLPLDKGDPFYGPEGNALLAERARKRSTAWGMPVQG